jgi:hypothetical protein
VALTHRLHLKRTLNESVLIELDSLSQFIFSKPLTTEICHR